MQPAFSLVLSLGDNSSLLTEATQCCCLLLSINRWFLMSWLAGRSSLRPWKWSFAYLLPRVEPLFALGGSKAQSILRELCPFSVYLSAVGEFLKYLNSQWKVHFQFVFVLSPQHKFGMSHCIQIACCQYLLCSLKLNSLRMCFSHRIKQNLVSNL